LDSAALFMFPLSGSGRIQGSGSRAGNVPMRHELLGMTDGDDYVGEMALRR
jgi:hypothetical protein